MLAKILYVSAAIAVAAFVSVPVQAGTILYTYDWSSLSSSGVLVSFNSSSPGVQTTIGSMGVQADYGALAYDTANNTMYLVDGFGNDTTTDHSSLYAVNLTTGAATLIGSTGLTGVTGLTFDSVSNALYAAIDESSGPLYSLNTGTGAATAVGSSIAPGGVSQLAFDTQTGVLYGLADCLGCAQIFTINPTTGVGTLLNGTGLDTNNSGLVYDASLNVLWDLDVRGYLTTFDPATGAQSSILGTSPSESSGLALVPAVGGTAPEPSTVILLGSGLAALWVRRRRSN